MEIFQRAAKEVVREGKTLIIDGRCESACAILADLARPNACFTVRAEMAVHKAFLVRVSRRRDVAGGAVPLVKLRRRFDPPHSKDIDQWVEDHGGYPREGMLVISLPAARQFWPMCDEAQLSVAIEGTDRP